MPDAIPATYKNGCLHPLVPLNIPDNQAVRLIILPSEPSCEKEEIVRIMNKAGLTSSTSRPPLDMPPDPVSEKERMELAEKLGKARGKPLSEIIISERDGQ